MFSLGRFLTGAAVLVTASTALSQGVTSFGGGTLQVKDRLEPTTVETSHAMCFGDGTGGACPAKNFGVLGHGCENSRGTGGAILTAEGYACVSKDTVRFHADSMPLKTTVILMQGTAGRQRGLPFGDGLQCLGGSLRKIDIQPAEFGLCTFPSELSPPSAKTICELGLVPARGGTRYYQALYRDPDKFGTPESFNLTNAWVMTWVP